MYLTKKEELSEEFIKEIENGLEEAKGLIEYWKGRKAAFEEVLGAVKPKEEAGE